MTGPPPGAAPRGSFVLVLLLLVSLAVPACLPGHGGALDAPAGAVRRCPDSSVLVRVPAGDFVMGCASGDLDEAPPHTVHLGEYWIGRTLVTNRQFAAFLEARRVPPPVRSAIHCDGKHYQIASGHEERPVTAVPWALARAYCAWADGRLPTEAEWEKAARGTDQRLYPWGNRWNAACANGWHAKSGVLPDDLVGVREMLTDVTAHAAGASPYGCLDMAGNAWEWCSSLYAVYPYRADDGREDPDRPGPRVIRAGSWYDHPSLLRCTNRFRIFGDFEREADRPFESSTGFRLAYSAPAPSPASASPASLAASPSPEPLARLPHPQFQLLTHGEDRHSADLDARYRLLRGPHRPGVILGYPPSRERAARYFVPIEHLLALSFYHARGYRRVLPWLHLRPGQSIADIGAGSGAVTRMVSAAVGPTGQVWATDIALSSLQSMLPRSHDGEDPGQDLYYFQRSWERTTNVYYVLHDVTDCLLPPQSFDLAFLGQVHYFYYPRARPGVSPPLAQVVNFYRSIGRSLKPDGRMAIVEHTENCDARDAERGVLKVSEMVAQMRPAGFALAEKHELPDRHACLLFKAVKP